MPFDVGFEQSRDEEDYSFVWVSFLVDLDQLH